MVENQMPPTDAPVGSSPIIPAFQTSGVGTSGYLQHRHSGLDSQRVRFNDLAEKRLWLSWTLPGTSAATVANYGVIFISPFNGYVNSFREVHQTAGSDAGAVTLTLERLTGTQAPDAGTAMLASALSLKTTANTVQFGTMSTTLSAKHIAIGDRLCLKDAGVFTSVANVTVLIEFVY